MGRVLHLGPSWHGPSFYVGRVGRGRVGFGPSCPAPLYVILWRYYLNVEGIKFYSMKNHSYALFSFIILFRSTYPRF